MFILTINMYTCSFIEFYNECKLFNVSLERIYLYGYVTIIGCTLSFLFFGMLCRLANYEIVIILPVLNS